jgi:hypothetical protein
LGPFGGIWDSFDGVDAAMGGVTAEAYMITSLNNPEGGGGVKIDSL